jgi:hypothetical protein
MPIPIIVSQAIPAKTGVTLLARVRGGAGLLITQASISSITLVVTDLTKEKAAAGSGAITSLALVVANTVYDALQWYGIWTQDGPNNPSPPAPFGDGSYGWNVQTTVPAANFANGGDRYRCDMKLVPVIGEQFVIPWEFNLIQVYA